MSTLKLSGGASAVAGKTAVTTTLSPAMACGTCMVLKYLLTKELSLGAALNGILAGLVGITSACSTVEPWAAVVIGMIAGLVYVLSSMLMLKLQLDDVVDAVAVHMACGMWGCIAPALFASQRNYASAYAASDKYGKLTHATHIPGASRMHLHMHTLIHAHMRTRLNPRALSPNCVGLFYSALGLNPKTV